jgi:hypothetical protein
MDQSQFETIGACRLNRKIEQRALAGIIWDVNEPADLCPDPFFSSSLSKRCLPPFGYSSEFSKVASRYRRKPFIPASNPCPIHRFIQIPIN